MILFNPALAPSFFLCRHQAILMTMPSVCLDDTHCPSAFDTVEFVAVVIFTIEYAMRIYAAPEAYPVRMRMHPFNNPFVLSSFCPFVLSCACFCMLLRVFLFFLFFLNRNKNNNTLLSCCSWLLLWWWWWCWWCSCWCSCCGGVAVVVDVVSGAVLLVDWWRVFETPRC